MFDTQLYNALLRARYSGGQNPLASFVSSTGVQGGDVAPDAASEALRQSLIADSDESQRQQFLDMISQEVEPQKMSAGSIIGLALANAATAYAAGLNPNNKPMDFISQVQALRERRAERETRRRQVAGRTGLDEINRREALEAAERARKEALEFQQEREENITQRLNTQIESLEGRTTQQINAADARAAADRKARADNLQTEIDARLKQMNEEWDRRIDSIEERYGGERRMKVEEKADAADSAVLTYRNALLFGDAELGIRPLAEQLSEGKEPKDIIREFEMRLEAVPGYRPATKEAAKQAILNEIERLVAPEQGPEQPSVWNAPTRGGGFSFDMSRPGFGLGDTQTAGPFAGESLTDIMNRINRVDIQRRSRP